MDQSNPDIIQRLTQLQQYRRQQQRLWHGVTGLLAGIVTAIITYWIGSGLWIHPTKDHRANALQHAEAIRQHQDNLETLRNALR